MRRRSRPRKKRSKHLVIGVDEAGRGPLAGPVVAAAACLGDGRFKSRIDDSKRLTPRQREKAFREISVKSLFAVGIVDEKVIDDVNIAVATRMAMEQAIGKLLHRIRKRSNPADKKIRIIIDGNVKPRIKLAFSNIIRGDSRYMSIACASIVAKVTRDEIMSAYDKTYPQYGFREHKGYPTKKHRQALKRNGPSSIHRMSFRDVQEKPRFR